MFLLAYNLHLKRGEKRKQKKKGVYKHFVSLEDLVSDTVHIQLNFQRLSSSNLKQQKSFSPCI